MLNNAAARCGSSSGFPANEKVSDDYLEPVPYSLPVRTPEGVLIAPVVDLVHMKLTSYRLKDQVHIRTWIMPG